MLSYFRNLLIPFHKKYFSWFYIAYAILGLLAIADFGVPLDELTQRFIGIENNRFIAGDMDAAHIIQHRNFGPFFESIAYLVEQLMYDASAGSKLIMRHTLLFLTFLWAIHLLYVCMRKMGIAMGPTSIACALLALHPVIFAHAHYNSKDTYFLSLLCFVLFFFMLFYEKKQFKMLVITCLSLGLCCSIRFNALFLLAGILFYLFFILKNIRYGLFSILFFIVGLYLFYPYLWLNPLRGPFEILGYVSSNPWPIPSLAANRIILPGHVPGWYLPLWLLVSIPVTLLILFIWGMVIYFRKIKALHPAWHIIAILFVLPFAYCCIAQPVMYDGWRHMQFLILPMVFFAALAMQSVLERSFSRYAGIALTVYSAVVSLYYHPFGYMYFNELRNPIFGANSFTQDYWTLSAHTALKDIEKTDTAQHIHVYSFTETLGNQLLIGNFKNKFHVVKSPDSAKYHIEIRRDKFFGPAYTAEIVRSYQINGDTFARVLKLK